MTPYLIIDNMMISSLCLAAKSGIEVCIVTPHIPDKWYVHAVTQYNYLELLRSGVKIYEYTPGFIHSKSMVSDDECAVVGTINFDYRSLYHHFENAVYIAGCEAVDDVKRDAVETFAISRERTLENTKRNIFGRLLDSVLRVFETLL